MKLTDPEEPTVFGTEVTPGEVQDRAVLVDTPMGRLALIVDRAWEDNGSPRSGKPNSPRAKGKIVAIDAWCPHLDGPLWEGSAVDGEIACPWHRWRFSLGTGQCTWAPAGDAEEAAQTEIQVFQTQLSADGYVEILLPPLDAHDQKCRQDGSE